MQPHKGKAHILLSFVETEHNEESYYSSHEYEKNSTAQSRAEALETIQTIGSNERIHCSFQKILEMSPQFSSVA